VDLLKMIQVQRKSFLIILNCNKSFPQDNF
jgi:hypothetical protein